MECRPATEADARGIAAVLIQSYNIASLEEGEAAFRGEMVRGYRYLVAVEGDAILGLTSWAPHGLPKHGLAELDRIAVASEGRGQGIAERLFQALLSDADAHYRAHSHGLRKLFLMTHADNLRAQAFYRKMGLQAEATLKDHFYKGKDEIVMSLFRD
ncbi:MAG: GNAT family N-acetyltransferase [Candidatus Latescibacteria bacterium]|nr:GNAT family N-acetyltransferase [Candidatus Latescibacterota bacterium]